MRIRCSRRFCTSSRTWRSGRTTRDFMRSWRRSRTRPRYAWRAILSCADGAWAEAPGRRARRVRGTRRRARRRDAGRRRDDRARARLRRDDVWAARRRRTRAIIRRIQDAPRRIARDAPPREVRIPARRILATSSSSTDHSIADHHIMSSSRRDIHGARSRRIDTKRARARARIPSPIVYEYSCHHRIRLLRFASRTTTHTSRVPRRPTSRVRPHRPPHRTITTHDHALDADAHARSTRGVVIIRTRIATTPPDRPFVSPARDDDATRRVDGLRDGHSTSIPTRRGPLVIKPITFTLDGLSRYWVSDVTRTQKATVTERF